MYKISGSVSDIVSSGEFGGKELNLQGVFVQEPESVSLSSVLKNALAIATTAAIAVINLAVPTRKIFVGAGTNANAWKAKVDALVTAGSAKKIIIAPDAGQEGKSLTWSKGAVDAGLPAGVEAAIDALIAPVKPTYSVDSIVGRIAATLPDNLRPVVTVDQANKQVAVVIVTNNNVDILAEIGAANPEPQHKCAVELDDPVVSPSQGDSSLPFEGGAV